MATHTPGPFLRLAQHHGASLAPCGCSINRSNDTVTDASVYLCAQHMAAPDLLAALRECLSELEATHTHGSRGASAVCGTCIEVIGYARAAIAKAEGRAVTP